MFVVLVQGPSMAPTLRHGDMLLVRRVPGPGRPHRRSRWGRRAVRPGDLVVARFRARPDLLVVKRVERPDGAGGWWVRSDNALAGDSSHKYGPAEVLGRVVLRWWPRPALVSRHPPPPGLYDG